MPRRFIFIAGALLMAVALLAACGGATPAPTATEAPTEAATEAPTEVATEAPTEVATEAPTEEPVMVTAFILPFGIYPDMQIATVADLASLGIDVSGVEMGEAAPAEGQFEQVPIITTATNVVGIGTYVAAKALAVSSANDPADSFTYEWSLVAPDGSQATLMTGPNLAVWLADVGGDYTLTLTATSPSGAVGEATWEVHATTYVGVGTVAGGEPRPPQCGTCHADKTEAWAATGHATFFTRAIDGEASDHYGPNCISCHTTGFNNRPEAVNGGFDDLAAEAGWQFPATLQAGNWDAFVADYPQVAAMANIQCESCHGPGADHNGGGPIGSSLAYGTCAQCHAEQPYHAIPLQWELSGHAAENAMAFTYPIGEEHTACVRCHSGSAFIDWAAGVPEEEQSTNYQVITCAVCHDPHSATNPSQLRVFDTVTLPDGTEVTSGGASATCMSCHNSRVDPVFAVEGERFFTPHYSTAAELLNNTGGYTWGVELPNSPHGMAIEESCVACHMAPTPGVDNMGTQDPSDDTPLPGHNTVGGHTFAMVSPVDGTENIATCQTCHADVTSFEFAAKADYDGDGTVETNQEEVAGLLEVLKGALEEQGVGFLPYYPYFQLPEDASVDLKGAVFNYKFALSGGSAVHNFERVVALLQLSYEKLTGEPVPNATLILSE
jgi:hypothetical protein